MTAAGTHDKAAVGPDEEHVVTDRLNADLNQIQIAYTFSSFFYALSFIFTDGL